LLTRTYLAPLTLFQSRGRGCLECGSLLLLSPPCPRLLCAHRAQVWVRDLARSTPGGSLFLPLPRLKNELNRRRQSGVEGARRPAELGAGAGVVEGPVAREALELVRGDRWTPAGELEPGERGDHQEARRRNREGQTRRRHVAQPADAVDQTAHRGHVAGHEVAATGRRLLHHLQNAVDQIGEIDPARLAVGADDGRDAPLEDLAQKEVRALFFPRRTIDQAGIDGVDPQSTPRPLLDGTLAGMFGGA